MCAVTAGLTSINISDISESLTCTHSSRPAGEGVVSHMPCSAIVRAWDLMASSNEYLISDWRRARFHVQRLRNANSGI